MSGKGQRKRNLFAPPSEHMRKMKASNVGKTLSYDGTEEISSTVFPSDLSSHFMAFLFKRHDYDGQSNEKMKLVNTIILPVPQNIMEQIQVDYNSAALGAVRGEISDLIAEGSIAGGSAAAGKFLSGAKDFVGGLFDKETYSGGNEGLGAALLGLRTGNEYVAAGLNRFFGSAPNPHLTVLFQGVGLRTHNFTWKLAPASRTETQLLSRVINSFRGSMLPERGASNLTLKYPDEVDIFIGGSAIEHLYHFKRAVVRNFSANYAPDGTPSFFRDGGAPTSVQLQLDLMETEIHTREDYEPNITFSNQVDTLGAKKFNKDLQEAQANEARAKVLKGVDGPTDTVFDRGVGF